MYGNLGLGLKVLVMSINTFIDHRFRMSRTVYTAIHLLLRDARGYIISAQTTDTSEVGLSASSSLHFFTEYRHYVCNHPFCHTISVSIGNLPAFEAHCPHCNSVLNKACHPRETRYHLGAA